MPNGTVCVKSVYTTDLDGITVLIGNANQQNGFLDLTASSERYKKQVNWNVVIGQEKFFSMFSRAVIKIIVFILLMLR